MTLQLVREDALEASPCSAAAARSAGCLVPLMMRCLLHLTCSREAAHGLRMRIKQDL